MSNVVKGSDVARMDNRTDRRTDEWTDGQTGGRMDGRTSAWTMFEVLLQSVPRHGLGSRREERPGHTENAIGYT